jgi:subtilisin family serine protease
MANDDPNNPKDPQDPNSQPPLEDAGAGLDPELVRRSKVSPHLWAMAEDWERRRQESPPGSLDITEPASVPLVKVLIELTGPDTTELESVGVGFRHLFEFVFSAQVPLDRLDELAGLKTILRVHQERTLRPTLDDSIPEIRATTVRNPQHPFSGTNKFTGAGVVIGIIDSGINILHPVFRLPNDQTKTRIIALLDQTQSPAVTFTKAQIETAIASDTQIIQPGIMVGGTRVETDADDHKHGTHVAGIAAGNGKKAGNCSGEFKYVGVAPEADLVIVKYDFNGGVDSLETAIRFIANTAAALGPPGPLGPVGVPAVINMSFGSSLGAHDGTDPLDRLIDNYLLVRSLLPVPVQPVVLVAAAGNCGGLVAIDVDPLTMLPDQNMHATGSIPPGGVVKSLRVDMQAIRPTPGKQIICRVEFRFTAPSGLGCQLVPPGNNITGSNQAAPDAVISFTENTQNSTCRIEGALVAGAPAGSRRIGITITSAAGNTNQPGEWIINLTNASAAAIPYHGWIAGGQLDRFKDDLSRANTIESPGSSTSGITVGNYASSGKDKGKIADSSSRGPLLNHPTATTSRQKPDLSAPGEDICSAKRDLHTGCCCDCCCSSYIDLSGTSMAAPHVTGAIALMLQRNPALTHDQIKTILMTNPNARLDSFTGTAPNNDFGAGKLDVLALLNDPLVRGTGPTISSTLAERMQIAPAIDASITAPELAHVLPQFAEGTPLWRLLNTAEGQRLYERGRTHWEEVRGIVNTQKRVATVWHRNYGPLILHHATRTAMLPHVPLPRELDGLELSVRAAKLVTALEPHASKELIRALHETLPLIGQLQGKTLLEVIEFFEERDAPQSNGHPALSLKRERSEETQHA